MAIRRFKHKGLKRFFESGDRSGINPSHAKRLHLLIHALDAAQCAEDMNLPGADFHGLKGKLRDFYSVHVNGNWAIIFRFEGHHAFDVDYLDYH
jgi:toxin HigB-1